MSSDLILREFPLFLHRQTSITLSQFPAVRLTVSSWLLLRSVVISAYFWIIMKLPILKHPPDRIFFALVAKEMNGVCAPEVLSALH
jgi:hypothetical protein